MSKRSLVMLLPLIGIATACAAIPPPRVLEEADEIGKSKAVMEAKELAPPAWARAEKRRIEAHEALAKGPQARAQFLGEEAIALYHQAVALARLTKAALREKAAQEDREALEKELRELDAEQARATADVDALEARLRTARAVQRPGDGSPESERDRREAAKSFVVQGKLLCAAARMLGAAEKGAQGGPISSDDPTTPANVARDLAKAEATVRDLEQSVADPKKPAPLEEAAAARAECSGILARARRGLSARVGVGSADALLEELGAMAQTSKGLALEPRRDERGVVAILRSGFEREELSAAAKDRIQELDRVAAAHPAFPIAIVVHTDKALSGPERKSWEQKGAAISRALGSVPDGRKLVVVAEDALPLVARGSSERANNTRVEIVFVAPQAL